MIPKARGHAWDHTDTSRWRASEAQVHVTPKKKKEWGCNSLILSADEISSAWQQVTAKGQTKQSPDQLEKTHLFDIPLITEK